MASKGVNILILIRTDANCYVASGHVMRCISIAKRLLFYGKEVIFVVSDQNSVDMVQKFGFQLINLKTIWNNMDLEIEVMISLIKQLKAEVLLIDSYYVSKSYFEDLHKYINIAYIDDLGLPFFEGEILINYSLGIEQFCYKRNNNVQYLLGSQFIPLRKEFCDQTYQVRKIVKNVLITTGGSDNCNVLYKLIVLLKQENINFPVYHFIVGQFNKELEALKKITGDCCNIKILEFVDQMDVLMKNCDLAVTAAGTTMYELCAIGVPTVIFAFADNQGSGAEQLGAKNIVEYVGDIRGNVELGIKQICSALKRYQSDFNLRIRCSQQMRNLVDGYGADRIARTLVDLN